MGWTSNKASLGQTAEGVCKLSANLESTCSLAYCFCAATTDKEVPQGVIRMAAIDKPYGEGEYVATIVRQVSGMMIAGGKCSA
jgi:hypothetical protein